MEEAHASCAAGLWPFGFEHSKSTQVTPQGVEGHLVPKLCCKCQQQGSLPEAQSAKLPQHLDCLLTGVRRQNLQEVIRLHRG